MVYIFWMLHIIVVEVFSKYINVELIYSKIYNFILNDNSIN